MSGRVEVGIWSVARLAEDLGVPSPDVTALLRESGLPGMKVLEFAFDAEDATDYQPHSYGPNCVCYTGTHDNQTLQDWLDTAPAETLVRARRYFGLSTAEGAARGMLRGGMGSVAELFVAQLQDWMELGPSGRINTPGTAGGNWTWRLLPGQLTPDLAEEIFAMTKRYGRLPEREEETDA